MPAPTKIVFHPAYLANKPHYERQRAWLDSTPEALAQYVVQTYLEKTDKDGGMYHQERLDLLDTDNQISAYLKIHLAELVKDKPTYTGMESEQAQLILADVDGKRNPAAKRTAEIFWQMLWAGMVPVEVFAPDKVGERKIDAQLSGERSFSRLYEPDALVAWSYFDDDGPMRGQLQQVVFENRICYVEKKKEVCKYRSYKVYWIDAPGQSFQSQIVRSKKTLAESEVADFVEVEPDPERGEVKTGQLQFIPVVLFGDVEQGVKKTVIYNACYDARIMLNKQSHLDTTNRYNHFPRHIMTGDVNPEQTSVDLANTTLGVIRGKDVSLHTLAAAEPVSLAKDITRLAQSIKQKVLLMPNQGANPESKEVESAESKRADQETRKTFYDDVTDQVQYGLESLYGWAHSGFEGEQNIARGKVQVTFKRDFEAVDPDTALQTDVANRLLAKSMGKAGQEYLKRVFVGIIRKSEIPALEGETEDEVKHELEKKVMDEDLAAAQADLLNAFARSRAGRPAEKDDEQEPAESDEG